MTQKALGDLRPGDRATVVKVGGSGSVRRRVLDMGIVPGSDIEVLRSAPLGDPIELRVKGYNLTLRKSESRDILVEV